jgi:iron complex transport system substrate-binding protein
VELPSDITRVSPSGALAQMFLIAIAPDLLVTVASDYTADNARYVPPYLSDLPVVGQFYGAEDLNFESIAKIAPQLVIDVGEPKKTITEDMDAITANLAIPAVHITAYLDSTPEAFRTLGKLLHREEKGEALARYCEKILQQTADVMADVGDGKVSALYLLGEAGLNVLAKTSFHAEVLDYLTDNRAEIDAPSSKGSGNETDLEQLSVWNPDFIIFAPEVDVPDIVRDPTWRQLSAISSGSFARVPMGPYNWMGSPPSINRYLGMLWLTYILYTGDATSFSADVIEYYDLFYGYTLTQAEVSAFLGDLED